MSPSPSTAVALRPVDLTLRPVERARKVASAPRPAGRPTARAVGALALAMPPLVVALVLVAVYALVVLACTLGRRAVRAGVAARAGARGHRAPAVGKICVG